VRISIGLCAASSCFKEVEPKPHRKRLAFTVVLQAPLCSSSSSSAVAVVMAMVADKVVAADSSFEESCIDEKDLKRHSWGISDRKGSSA